MSLNHWLNSDQEKETIPQTQLATAECESGPTIVGDEWSDPELMEFLGAQIIHEFGNNFKEYRSADPPRMILNKLESRGYRVIGMTGIGQTCIWTCYKENDNVNQVENNGGS